jgi:hypothetical protein
MSFYSERLLGAVSENFNEKLPQRFPSELTDKPPRGAIVSSC